MTADGTDFTAFEAANQPDVDPAPADDPNKPSPDDEGGGEAEVPEEEGDPVAEQPAKKDKTAQGRFDELTRARREAEREAKYWRDVAMGKVTPEQNRQAPEGPQPPNPDNYDLGDMDPRYQEALVDYKVDQKLSSAGLDKLDERVAQSLQRQAGERVWEARQDEARSKYDDYDQKVTVGAANGDWPCSPEMAEVIKTSDAGGDIAYHLASNPAEAQRIAQLSPLAQARELGRIEAGFSAPVKAQAKTTNAPKPATAQARGAGGEFAPNSATTDFALFEAMAKQKT